MNEQHSRRRPPTGDRELTPELATELATELGALVAEFGTARQCGAISWGVVSQGSIVASGGWVDARAREFVAQPPGDTTLSRIASMTKSFSAALTLLLRDEGVIRLDDPLSRWAPELNAVKAPVGDASEITIANLLSMTAGLTTDDPWADRHVDLTAADFADIVRVGVQFATPTGSAFEYSNFGFALLGRVIERATGTSIQTHITERLLKPLGMRDSVWDVPPLDGGATALPPLRWYDDVGYRPELPPLADGLIAPMGGIWSTIADLARWVHFLDDAFPSRSDPDDGPVSRSTRREMQTPKIYCGRGTLRSLTNSTSYGYGLRIQDEDVIDAAGAAGEPRRAVTHSGGFPGYGSSMRWFPGHRLGAVALANTTYAPMTELVALLLDRAGARMGVGDGRAAGGGPAVANPGDGDAASVDLVGRRLIATLNEMVAAPQPDGWTATFTDNVALDLSLARRRAEISELAPFTIASVEVVTAGRGVVHVTTVNREPARIAFWIAPPLPARVQKYTVERQSHSTSIDDSPRK